MNATDIETHARLRPEIRGVSEWANSICDQIRRFAPFNSSVLVSGPSGTGKELIARSLHSASPRAQDPFVPVDCAAMTGELMASQLFGHLQGAFTGANHATLGYFRAAHRGTIFLDEIGELDLSLQAKLLRVLQERVVTPVGAYDGMPVDVRVVAATNRDLADEVQAGRFREDLYYRLNVISLRTQALADRPEDIRPLTLGFLDQLASEGMPQKRISDRAVEILERFTWLGNVRQLKNLLEQAVIGCDGPLITDQYVRELLEGRVGTLGRVATSASRFREPAEANSESQTELCSSLEDADDSWRHDSDREWITLDAMERKLILKALEHTYYNRAAAARLLGISRQSLLRKMKKQRIERPARCAS